MLLVKLIEQAMQQDEIEPWESALAEALKYKEEHPESPESLYIIGYIYFEFPNRTKDQTNLSKIYLNLCLERKPDHQLALYHLGIIHFLQQEYNSVLSVLNKTDHQYFVTIGQSWRIVKIEELKLASRLYLNEEVPIIEIRNFFDLCVHADPIEVPVLIEIARCLNDFLEGKFTGQISEELVRQMQELALKLNQQSILKKRAGPFYDYFNGKMPN
jgi:tetratricopeptide (TPR) repeat protein